MPESTARSHVLARPRDLKPENLLLSSQRQLKVADFGFASEYVPGKPLDVYCGSVAYASPGTRPPRDPCMVAV
jgi:serine/threonine protein kinase